MPSKDPEQSETKLCFKCWSKVPADASFCEVCGAVFQDKDEKYVPDNNPVRSFEESPIKMAKPSKLWAAIPVLLVVLVAAFLLVNSGIFSSEPEQGGMAYAELSHEWSSSGDVLYVTVEILNGSEEPIRGERITCDCIIGNSSYSGSFTASPKEILSPGESCRCSLMFSVLPKDAFGHHSLRFVIR